jgi:hypothetical protein
MLSDDQILLLNHTGSDPFLVKLSFSEKVDVARS